MYTEEQMQQLQNQKEEDFSDKKEERKMENENTIFFKVEKEKKANSKQILKQVYEALVEKGYNPINQIVGYILSGDPTYITSYKDSRSLIRQFERDELLEEMVKEYIGVNEEWKY